MLKMESNFGYTERQPTNSLNPVLLIFFQHLHHRYLSTERIFSLCGLMTAGRSNRMLNVTGNESIPETEQSTRVICLKLGEMTVHV